MSSESKGNSELKCPEGFPPEGWAKLSDSDRRRIVELEKLMAEYKTPSDRDDRVALVSSLNEDSQLICDTLQTAGVSFGIIGALGMALFDVPAAEYDRAMDCLQREPRLAGRFEVN